MLRWALLLLVLAAPAATAAELRPLGSRDLCIDGGTKVQPGINRVRLADCNDEEGQNVRRGKMDTLFIGELCLQAIGVKGSGRVELAMMRCHGRDGQRWFLTRGGQLTSGEQLCLTVIGEDASPGVEMKPCLKSDEDGVLAQKWAVYGKLD